MGTSARGEVEKWLFHLVVRWRRRREELSHHLPLISYYHTLITTYHIYTLIELWIIKVLANCSLPLPLPLPGKIGNSLFIIHTHSRKTKRCYIWMNLWKREIENGERVRDRKRVDWVRGRCIGDIEEVRAA